MSWHSFTSGESYSRDYVVAVCEEHINKSGQVENPEQKLLYVEQIRNSPYGEIVYAPKGEGWDNSPMNPRSWQTTDGDPICETKHVPTGK
jgi:hypothetical protein